MLPKPSGEHPDRRVIPGAEMIDVPGTDRPLVMAGPVPAIPTGSVAACDCIFRNAGACGDGRD